ALWVYDSAAADRRRWSLRRVRSADPRRMGLTALLVLLQTGSATVGGSLRSPLPRATFEASTFDALVLEGIRAGAYPGAALIVGRRDTVLFAKGYGHLTWARTSAAADPES